MKENEIKKLREALDRVATQNYLSRKVEIEKYNLRICPKCGLGYFQCQCDN